MTTSYSVKVDKQMRSKTKSRFDKFYAKASMHVFSKDLNVASINILKEISSELESLQIRLITHINSRLGIIKNNKAVFKKRLSDVGISMTKWCCIHDLEVDQVNAVLEGAIENNNVLDKIAKFVVTSDLSKYRKESK